MKRRTAPLFLLLLALLGGVLAALPGSAQATPVTTPAPGTVLLAQRVIRPGTLHDQAAYQAHFQVQGYPGDTQPGLVQMLSGARTILSQATLANPCPDPGVACGDVWDVWVPIPLNVPAPGVYDVRFIVHEADQSGGSAGNHVWLDLGAVSVWKTTTVRVVNQVRANRARVWSGRFVGRCSRMKAPGRLLGAGSVALRSQVRCRRHRNHAGRVQQIFQLGTTPLAGSERVTYPKIGVLLASKSTRGKIRVWTRATGSGAAWTPCSVNPGRRGTWRTCVVPWSPDFGDRAFGTAQVLVRAQHGARVDVGQIQTDVGYYVWTAP